MTIRIGGIGSADAEGFLRAMSTPFGFDLTPDELPQLLKDFQILFEPDRARCAFHGDQMVGTLGAFTLPMTVPGGTMPVGGTTMVTVLPSHRRQGVLRMMIQAHFEEVRSRGETAAALWASDSAIYHRFGFGMATVFAQVAVKRDHVRFHRLAPEALPVRLVSGDEIRTLATPVYDAEASRRPGMYARNEGWWQRRMRDRKSDREGATAFRYAVVERDGVVEGYVQYRIKSGQWAENHGDGEVIVREIMAITPQAARSLWAFMLEHDLTAKITANNLAEDNPLFALLDGWRRASPRLLDQMWMRILDIDGALENRRYSSDGSLIFAIHDPMDGSLTNRRLTVDGGAGFVETVTDDADIHLDIEDLGASYLGRARFRQLARAGRLTGTDDALTIADEMFAWDPPPWCQETF